ncbi:MAG: IMS domain-containing protein [Rhizonema sp. NSF051]|nr:IMS domain-containing protein [Rhizonema sp. NSF051]
MQIPLDYYRILGLPLAASDEQLRQAYNDRIVQLPRREYSQAAIGSRKQLIEEAYVVLSDPKERIDYDQLYLANAYSADGVQNATVAVSERLEDDLNRQTLNIQVSQQELVGALLILQELGEYELVLKLGRPYLINQNTVAGVKQNSQPTSEESYVSAVERPDILLTVSLACLELGREQWQQGYYENAAVSLETGEDLLLKEGLFPSVQAEIQADLYRLRPYRILELLALPEEKTDEREQGLQLLQNILEDRGGIDGTKDDQSGLNIDDFLRFIQQLRNYLTVVEQHELFERESKRHSPVATYLAVYALIARGFTQRQPALIRQAKQMLLRLGKRQDVHLEQSLCALLLGQTEVATRSLELSQEYEALVFIREHSQDSPDLLPGLCLYLEVWLQDEVFQHFRDLAKQAASLKDYFADEQVQASLEALPTDAEMTNEWTGINSQSIKNLQTTHSRYPSKGAVRSRHPNSKTDPKTPLTPTQKRPEYSNASPLNSARSPTPSQPGNPRLQTPVTPPTIATDKRRNLNGKAAASLHQGQKPRRRRSSQPGTGRVLENGRDNVHQRRSFARTSKAQTLVVWKIFASLAGILILLFLTATTFGWIKNQFFTTSEDSLRLSVQLNQQPVPIPDPNSTQLPIEPLTAETAKDVIQTWLSTKGTSLGSNHDIASLQKILVEPALSQWHTIAQQDKKYNRYRKYNHSLKVESLNPSQTEQNHVAVEASVTEITEFYENSQIKKTNSEKLRVKYDLVNTEGAWRIQNMSVVNKLS